LNEQLKKSKFKKSLKDPLFGMSPCKRIQPENFQLNLQDGAIAISVESISEIAISIESISGFRKHL